MRRIFARAVITLLLAASLLSGTAATALSRPYRGWYGGYGGGYGGGYYRPRAAYYGARPWGSYYRATPYRAYPRYYGGYYGGYYRGYRPGYAWAPGYYRW